MEGGDAAVVAELAAVAATVAGHVPELGSEIGSLLTQDIRELRGDRIVEKPLDAHRVGHADSCLAVERACPFQIERRTNVR
jgi:hypothetical protein